MEKSRSVSTILVFLGLDPAPPSFRHARPRVRRPSGLDSSVLGPVSNSEEYTTLWLWKPEFDSRIGHHVKKGKRGVCQQKASTVLPNRTAAA